MLSNAYFLAKIRNDTAENEPAKNLQLCKTKTLISLMTSLKSAPSVTVSSSVMAKPAPTSSTLRLGTWRVDKFRMPNSLRYLAYACCFLL